MDFQQLDKYDLFNAPQYVDFNQFVLNDGFSNDNADKFFETHREEDDFFPAEMIDGSVIIPTTFNTSPPAADKSTTTHDTDTNSQVENAVGAQNGLQKKTEVGVTTQMVQVKVEDSKPYAMEINYEEVANLKTDTAKAEKLKRIMEIEAAERLKLKQKYEEIEKKYLNAETIEVTSTTTTTTEIYKIGPSTVTSDVAPVQSQLIKNEMTAPEVHAEFVEHIEATEDTSAAATLTEPEEVVRTTPNELKKRAKSVQIKSTPTVRRSRSLNRPKSTSNRSDDNASGDHHKASHEPTKQMKNTLAPIPKSIPVRVTIPKPFKLSETRVRKVQIPESDTFKFKAKPAPMRAMQATAVSAVKPPPRVTQPMDFHFASEDRIRDRNNMKRKSVPNAAETHEPMVSKPKPSGIYSSRSALGSACSSHEKMSVDGSCPGSATKVRIRPRSLSADRNRATHVQPFSFEERDKELMRKKEEKIRKMIEEQTKSTEFHAQPLPDFSKAQKHMPAKHVIPVTTAKPFALKCDQRGAHYQEELHRKLEEEKARLRQLAEFHANPASVIHRKPFVPEKSNVPVAEPLNINLNTDKRAEDRAKYDDLIKQKEAELEALRKQEQVLKEEQEKKLTQALRQMRIHKAKPPPKSRVFEVKHSERPLTEPKSPAFAPLPSERRAKQPHHVENKENVKH